jgi:hypothetical protein
VSLVVQHAEEFTTVRRDNDGWLLGAVRRVQALDGWSVIVLWPLGVRDGRLYRTESDAVAAIGRHQFTVVRTVVPLRRHRKKIS